MCVCVCVCVCVAMLFMNKLIYIIYLFCAIGLCVSMNFPHCMMMSLINLIVKCFESQKVLQVLSPQFTCMYLEV